MSPQTTSAEHAATPPIAASGGTAPVFTGIAVPSTAEKPSKVASPPLRRAAAGEAKRNGRSIPSGQDYDVCTTCGSGGRNLVVCIDGTSNQFDKTRNTNVVELYSRLIKNERQLTFYNSGIGTYAQPSWKSWAYYKRVLVNRLDLAFALRFEKIIFSAYAWLADQYQEGDRIFLFGFSRGAYQVRALSAMIETVGLIHKGNGDQISFAYELYHAASNGEPTKSQETSSVAPVPGPTSSRGVEDDTASDVPEPSQSLTTLNVVHAPAATTSHAVVDEPAVDTITSFRTFMSKLKNTRRLLPDAAQPRDVKLDTASPTNDITPARNVEDTSNAAADHLSIQARFKKTFARSVKIHFVGAWDTVSSVGIVRNKTLPMTTDGMTHVCFFRHALALHERRVKFLPEYARGGAGPDPRQAAVVPTNTNLQRASMSEALTAVGSTVEGSEGGTRPTTSLASRHAIEDDARATDHGIGKSPTSRMGDSLEPPRPHTKEVWFSGCHGDIGGGSNNLQLNNFGPALRWMSFEALLAGIALEDAPVNWASKPANTNSMTPVWRFIELWPIKRLSYKTATSTTSWPHIWSSRDILPGQLIHETAKEAKDHPPNRREEDPYTTATAFLKVLKECAEKSKPLSKDQVQKLHVLVSSAPGQQSLRDVKGLKMDLVKMLYICKSQPIHSGAVMAVVQVQRALFGLEHSFSALQRARPVSEYLDIQGTEGHWSYPLPLQGHGTTVRSAAFTNDRENAVSFDSDGFVRVWDVVTGGCRTLFTVDDDYLAATLSPNSLYLASGTRSGTVSVWEVKGGTRTSGPLFPVTDCGAVFSVAFSPDDSQVAAGFESGLIIVWDALKGTRSATLVGHTRIVSSVAFVPAGDHALPFHLVSGSRDSTVRIWDLNRGEEVAEAFPSPDELWSIAVYRRKRRVLIAVASSWEGKITLWDATGKSREPLHTFKTSSHRPIYCVAFSPRGTHIVSGSRDGTVRLWDVKGRRQVGGELRHGETAYVVRVGFSGDGTRIISADDEGIVRIWDRIVPEDGARKSMQ